MTIELALLISVVSVSFAIYFGVSSKKRTEQTDVRNEASQLTTVIVKLENIGNGIAEIKNEMSNVKNDVKEDREMIVRIDESTKSAHRRLDTFERYPKRSTDTGSLKRRERYKK